MIDICGPKVLDYPGLDPTTPFSTFVRRVMMDIGECKHDKRHKKVWLGKTLLMRSASGGGDFVQVRVERINTSSIYGYEYDCGEGLSEM